MFRVLVLAVLLVCASAPAARSQTLEDFLSLLTRYAADADGAVEELVTAPRWKNGRSIEDNQRACLPMLGSSGDASPCNTRRRALAAMLHAEAATRLAVADPDRALFHFKLARQMGVHVKERPAFTEKWYELLTLMRLSEGDTLEARRIAIEAAGRLRGSAVPAFLTGVVSEVGVMFDLKNLREPADSRDIYTKRILLGMVSAGRDYARALDINPAFDRARLRLGWTQTVLDAPGAERSLMAASESTDSSVRYLSRLFLGSLAAGRGQLDRALAFYQSARQHGPTFQSACLGVSQTLHALAEQARSEAIASECLESSDDDPWWSYRVGAVEPALIFELRREAALP